MSYRTDALKALGAGALDIAYVTRLGIDHLPSLAVKAIGSDSVKGYLALWGNPDRVDLDTEYFTKGTNFWDGSLSTPRPLTWEHAQDGALKAPPVIGQIIDMGDDDIGRWYVATLDRAHRYARAVRKLIDGGLLGTSSDSAPQYVEREARGKATWLKTWPLFAATLTVSPCEPRMVGTVDYYKSLGLILPDAEAPRQTAEAVRMSAKEAEARIKRVRLGGL